MSENPFTNYSEPALAPSGTLDLMSRGARDGAADAREMAQRAWSGTSLFFSRFVYTTSYTFSYGVVFPATLLARSIPRDNAAVRGLIDGARAATRKVDQIQGHESHLILPAGLGNRTDRA
jgi:hypothetical protein